MADTAAHAGDAWIDFLLESIEAWPFPLWVSFTALAGLSIVLLHGIEWTLGGLPAVQFNLYVATLPIYPLGILAVIAIQNRVSASALARFRPITDMDDEGYARVRYELTHQPPLSAWIAGVTVGLLGATIEATKEGAAGRWAEHPAAYLLTVATGFFFYAFAGPWLVRTFRLLAMVARLHREAPRVDLLNPDPVHAFSSVTASGGLGLIAITTLSITTDPATHGTMAGLVFSIFLLVLAMVCFVAPLWGMHRRLQTERARMVGEVSVRIELTLQRLYEHVDEDRSGATEFRDRMLALTAARDMVMGLSTWPWRPETPRWLISALVIPLALWFFTRLLEGRLL